MTQPANITIQEGATRPPRLLSLSEVAEVLGMKRSNVAKFLARRDITPGAEKAQGFMWWEADILRIKAEREADAERMEADQKRREAALRRARGHGVHTTAEPLLARRLGPSQRKLLGGLLVRPASPVSDAERLALRRLRDRGFVEPIPNEPGFYRLTNDGREVAMSL